MSCLRCKKSEYFRQKDGLVCAVRGKLGRHTSAELELLAAHCPAFQRTCLLDNLRTFRSVRQLERFVANNYPADQQADILSACKSSPLYASLTP